MTDFNRAFQKWGQHMEACAMCQHTSKTATDDLSKLCRRGRRLYNRVPNHILNQRRVELGILTEEEVKKQEQSN